MARQIPSLPPHDPHRQPACPPLFYLDVSLLPGLEIPYKWWEDDAVTILWAFSIHDIRRLLRFRLYTDDSVPRAILRDRNADTVKGFLRQLLSQSESFYVDQLPQAEIIEHILVLCRQNRPSQTPWSWSPSTSRADEIKTIAANINRESCKQLQSVPFEDWIRYSLGYYTPSVEWFFEQHRELYRVMYTYLTSFPQEIDRYLEVEEHLRSHSPFAHLAVLECLKSLSAVARDTSSFEKWFVDFLVKPIRELFKSQISGLSKLLRKLSVLATRFRQAYQEKSVIKWNSAFETKSRYLDELLADNSAFVLARTLTLSDEEDFSVLSMNSFTMRDGALRVLICHWRELCKCAEECYTANTDMADYLQDCAKNLHSLKNYHAASAILHGLQRANPSAFQFLRSPKAMQAADPGSIPACFVLLDSNDNYGAYRRLMRENPGLPFLLPHLKEYRLRGQEAIADIFPLPLP
ncbi:hypothetical protein VTO42DRAFT_1669 [Malbranchea cinnamomea]